LLGPRVIKDKDKEVQTIRENPRVTQSRQIIGICRFKVEDELSLKYFEPLRILARRTEVVY